ncbi:Translocating chain-associated membrane protein 1-like 1 [Acropora cervicornis]|uniref:Translocating chain-associated membrane protein 1-like 1 n=1 Tax=Acropora cervicornis TaxID=6130 RepID=A0AAD9PSX3_ACRCE|nr:Translocating chain-associated membrane protein 1-like 1 [Acropora cervicornis]
MPTRRKSGKNAPIFSHEFIITNHGDIVSCVCMLFMIGLMFQATSKVAAVFIAPQHNVTKSVNGTEEPLTKYTNGPKDFCTIFFYSMAWIVVHAIIQEYVWDKISRKLKLSKTKNTKFNDSGILLPFYFFFAAWGTDIIVKEEILPKVQLYIEYLLFIWAAYMLNFTHVTLCCLVVHYIVESVHHAIRMLTFSNMEDTAKNLFWVWTVLFSFARFTIIALAVMTFWYGLPRLDNAGLNVDSGNFNSAPIRLTAMAGVVLMQAWLAWNFICYQIRVWRENSVTDTARLPKQRENRKKNKKEDNEDAEESEKANGSPRAGNKAKKA